MITLITGTPGSGKTAWTVQELTRLPTQRKLFVHGIPELKIAHDIIYCKSPLCDICQNEPDEEKKLFYLEKWPEWATQGSLIVADEVQRIWTMTNAASAKTDDISRLQTHRHMGLDFWLISQNPKLLHQGVRTLVGRHIHLVSKWSGRSEYEFPECKDNTDSRGDAVIRPYKLPKQVFKLYKSSSLHTKQTHRKPLALYAFLLVLAVILFFSYRVYDRMHERSNLDDPETSQAKPLPEKTPSVHAPLESKTVNFPDFKPEIPNLAISAPAYRKLVEVTAVPHLIGCVKTPRNCTCYSKQAVPVSSTPEFCEQYIQGHYFNPYRKQPDQHEANNTLQQSKPKHEQVAQNDIQ